MINKDKLQISVGVALVAILGAFASHYIETALKYPAIIAIIILIASGFILVITTYFFIADFLIK
ncbi:MAG: hypothetical protein WC471_02330 [Candidatus Woesearchaeota archaeon]